MGELVGARHLGQKLSPISEFDDHFARIADHMGIGQDQAIRAHDKARAFVPHRRAELWR